MKKERSCSAFQRVLSALLCLSMVLSVVAGMDLPELFDLTENVDAAEETPDPNEYKDETLEHMWDSDGDGSPTDEDYWNAARSYYACTVSGGIFASFGGVYKRTIFHVYAFEGETICLGSSVYNSGLGLDHKLQSGLAAVSGSSGYSNSTHFPDEDSVDIVMTDLKGNKIPIDIKNTGDDQTGYIATPKAEFAAVKMKMKSDGTFEAEYDGDKYTPYTYKVKETGLYTFEFHSYDGTGAANPNIQDEKFIHSQWPTADTNYIDDPDGQTSNGSSVYNDSGGLIAALNITVFDENCQKQTGRTYADFLSLQMSNISGKNVTESYYVLTTDSYIYKMTFNNAMPYTYNFFSNNRGIFDNATGEIVYKSVKDVSNTNSFQKMGSFFVYPGNKETEKDKSFYIFLEYPDVDLEGEIYQKAVQPDPATNIRFVGRVEIEEGGAVKEVPGAYEGVGGYFAFDVKEATTATLRLEFKGELEDKNLVPVEISGVVKPNSTNYFYWDGKDGNGNLVPAGEYDLNDIVYTVTAKAGEIHFPIFDMECAPGGITFTRLSHIYDKNGVQLDTPGSIYELTKSVIYYDETAIYYGENVAVTGISESQVTGKSNDANDGPIKRFFEKYKEKFWQYHNLNKNNGEYNARISSYIGETITTIGTNSIRIGDHSHTTNVIDYFDTLGNVLGTSAATSGISDEQKKMIDYLDSEKYPVGLSDGSGEESTDPEPGFNSGKTNGMSTTDYAIANYWTFIPAKPATTTKSDELLYIVDPPSEDLFKLTGRVFYDVNADGKKGNGIYDDSGANGEHLMSGVTLNLYKVTSDSVTVSGKKYYNYNAATGKMESTNVITPGVTYEFVDTGATRTDGSYVFTNLTYNKTNGTEYLYEVVRPDSSYELTSGKQNAKILNSSSTQYGYYASHSFDEKGTGNEIQIIKVGGDGGVDPTHLNTTGKPENTTHIVCAVDVGYYYATMQKSVWLKKTWDPEATSGKPNPASVIYELSYYSGTSGYVYDYRTLSGGGSWTDKNLFLPTRTNGRTVNDYYVSAEYFIDGDYIYKYSFKFNTSTGKYSSFVADAYRKSLTDIFAPESVPENCTVNDLPDQNGDGVSDGKDLEKITGWVSFNEKDVSTSYRAVLDRNILADKTEITVTNSKEHGTIELFKYSEINSEDHALQGATFRLYKATMSETMEKIGEATWREKNLVDAATTRSNGRLTFTGLDSTKTYTLQELFAPDGYRITQEFYEVRPQSEKSTYSGDGENVFFFGDKDPAGHDSTDDPDYAYVAAGNAPADTSLKIRKRIVGRAWQGGVDGGTKDSFTFDISNEFAATGISDLNNNADISVDTDEQSFQENTLKKTQEQIIEALNNFADNFQSGGSPDKNTVTIDYNSEYYNYEDTIAVPPVTISSADTKMSDLLLKGSNETASSKPTFQEIEFPMAGNYTFTIKEKNFAEALNLEKSTYVYKVVVSVVRKLNTGEPEGAEPTAANTHLEASVSNITYSEDDGSVYKTFVGSSPLFTNEYRLAPAEQTTSYNIVKSFTGRDWKDDEFTVDITSADSETATAVESGNLKITGFLSSDTNLKALENGKGWKYTFKKDDDILKFTSFKFENIEFPVQYVKNGTGDVWDPVTERKESPDTTQIGDGTDQYSPHTMPVTYTFNISETMPGEAEGDVYNGITYDSNKYVLTIVLNNTENTKIENEGAEEEDGIIEEIDVTLKKINSAGVEIGTSKCTTTQHTMTQAEWLNANNAGSTYWYVHPTTKALEKRPTPPSTVPSDTKIFIEKTEKHATNGEGLGTDGHTMTINNEYHTSYEWVPKIMKTLEGREWTADDAFTFTISHDSDSGSVDAPDGYVMPGDTDVIITKDTADHIANISPIEFVKAGTYHFVITEVDKSNTPLGEYKITVEVTDDEKGKLIPKITGFDGKEINDNIIEFTNNYFDTDFTLNIAKTIEGRAWKTDDTFTFKITPDPDTQAAIDDGTIVMPTGLTQDGGGSYTITLNKTTVLTEPLTKEFGKITIKNTGTLTSTSHYKFTIEEVTSDLKEMYCREPKIDLYVTVKSKSTSGTTTSKNELVATFAHIVSGETPPAGTDATDKNVTIPFTNVAAGTLTVGKKVVTNSKEDKTEFDFKVTFTYDDALKADADYDIKVNKSGEDLDLEKSPDDKTWTYTFKLKNGDSVEFSNIPPKTQYTITETIANKDKEKYILLRVCNENKDNGGDMRAGGVGDSVSGTINPDSNGNDNQQYRLFVNGLIMELPSTGDFGIEKFIFYGTALTVGAIMLLAMLYCKRRKRRESEE